MFLIDLNSESVIVYKGSRSYILEHHKSVQKFQQITRAE